MKIIKINPSEYKIQRTYLEVAIGIKDTSKQKENLLLIKSTTNQSQREKENESLEEDDKMTQETNNTVQIKLIKELQASISMLQASQQQILTYIASLEDAVISLLDTEDNSVGYRKAQRVAKKIKRKHQDRKRANITESNLSEDSTTVRRAPQFKNTEQNNKTRFFTYKNTLKGYINDSKQDMDLEEEKEK